MAQNSEMLDLVSPQKLQELDKVIEKLDKIVDRINAANAASRNSSTPGGNNSNTNNNNSNTNSAANNLRDQERLIAAQNRRNRATAEEIVNNRILAQNADRLAVINSKLSSEYQKLAARQAQAAREVQNLVARGKTAEQTQRQYNAELRKAQAEFSALNTRVVAANRAVGRYNDNVGNYPSQAIRGIRDLVSAFGVVGGVTLFAVVAKDIFNTTKEIERLNLALKQVSGSQEVAAQAQSFLSKTADDFGISLASATQQYVGFYTAAKDKLPLTDIQQIFESVSKAAGALGLTVDQQTGAFRALEQMLSKGNIQAEEIRGQLGERLPGAFGILAKSMGVTEQELNKLLKDGKVLAADVLPAFARELERAYNIDTIDRVESLTAETNRLGNAWREFVATISEGDGIINKTLTGALSLLKDIVQGFDAFFSTSAALADKGAGKTRVDNMNRQLNLYRQINEEAGKEYALQLAQEELSKNSQEVQQLEQQQKLLRDNNKSLQDLVSNNKKSLFGAYSKDTRDANKAIEINNELIDKNKYNIAVRNGYIDAARKFIEGETKAIKDSGDAEDKKHVKSVDYMAAEYELRKKQLEGMVAYYRAIYNNENEGNLERFKAAEKLTKSLIELEEMRYDETVRVSNRETQLKIDDINQQLSEEKVTRSSANAAILSLQKQNNAEIEKAQEELRQNLATINKDISDSSESIWPSLDEVERNNLLADKTVYNLQRINNMLKETGKYMSAAEFDKLAKSIEEIGQADIEAQLESLEAQKETVRQNIRKIELEAKSTENNIGLAANYLKLKNLNEQILTLEGKKLEYIRQQREEAVRLREQYYKGFTNQVFSDAGLGSLTQFVDGTFQKLLDGTKLIEDAGERIREQFKLAFTASTEVAQEFFNFLQQNNEARFQAQYAQAEREKDIALRFAGESEAGRAAIEQQYEDKRREIRRRELQAQKEQAIFNAIINTAQAVVAALPNIALAAIVGAIGAAQIALISARQIPAYAEGTDYHPGGAAIVGDGGRREVIWQPSSGYSITPANDTLVNLERGSKVFPDADKFMMGAGVDFAGGSQLSKSDMRDVMMEAFSGIAVADIRINESGIHKNIRKGSARTKLLNDSVRFNRVIHR